MRPARLREAHAHVGQLGRALSMIDLGGARSVADVVEALAEAADSAGEDDWILAQGLRVEALAERRWPTAAELDRGVGSRPGAAMSFDHHSLVASSRALVLARIEEFEGDRSLVERDRAGGPTGVLYEDAARRLRQAAPGPTPDQRRRELRTALDLLREMGFVEIHDMLAHAPLVHDLDRMDREGELAARAVRIELYVPADELDDVLATRKPASGNPRVRVAGVKAFLDGTLNCRTAWMLEPYADAHPDHPHGLALIDPDPLRDLVRRCDRMGLPLATHAIGDGAVRAILDAIEDVRPATRGYRVEHAELIDEADVPRFARLSVVCSPQPCHLLPDVEALNRYLPHRLDRVLPLRDLIDAGATPGELLVFGSDVPIVRADPEDSVLAATHRRRADMDEADAIAPAQAITEAEAWTCFAPAGGA